jgi:DNA polymerase-4
MDTRATILHADLDAFYASVEQLLDPSLRGKPIAVGGGVVLAASYEAKSFGISSGMSGRRARELCPQLIFVGGHFQDYQRLGDAAINVLNDFTPLVERISIDEAFADVAGCSHLFGSPPEIASAVRRRVRAEFGLPISIGVARTKHLAKIASQVAKPDGLVVVDPDTELDFLHNLPVELMWGVGPVTRARLAEIGVHTIGQLAKMPPPLGGRSAGFSPLSTRSFYGFFCRYVRRALRAGRKEETEWSHFGGNIAIASASNKAPGRASWGTPIVVLAGGEALFTYLSRTSR